MTLIPLLLALACTDKAGTDDTGPSSDDSGDSSAPVDADADGFDATEDCNDDDPAVFPGADELCNGVDDDCDEVVDEDAVDPSTWYGDSDGDGIGSGVGTIGCDQPPDTVERGDDCDDNDASVFPGADEICGDGVVNDCDGTEEEALAACSSAWPESVGTAGAILHGDHSAGYAAARLATGGDVNGDGIGDIAVGAPEASTTLSLSGGVYLILGGVNGESTLETEAEAVIEGTERWAYLGSSIAIDSIGGDSSADLIVGSPRLTNDGGGSVYIFHGPVSGALSPLDADARVDGETKEDNFAEALSTGDVNGDGAADLLVGASKAQSGGRGAARLFLGPIDSDRTSDSADTQVNAPESYYSFAKLVDLRGDLDGDGMNELVVSSPYYNNGSQDWAGRVLAFNGSATPDADLDANADADLDVVGTRSYENIGLAIATADVDGDGKDDLVIGAELANSSAGTSAGAVYVIAGGSSGVLGQSDASLTLEGEAEWDGAGASVANAGDIDGDGDEELLVGAPYLGNNDTVGGAAYLMLGGATGTVSLADAYERTRGEAIDDGLGEAIAGGTDLDGDGTLDVVIGAPGVDDSGDRSGAAYVLYGGLDFGY